VLHINLRREVPCGFNFVPRGKQALVFSIELFPNRIGRFTDAFFSTSSLAMDVSMSSSSSRFCKQVPGLAELGPSEDINQ
jgi:hypothetical protein